MCPVKNSLTRLICGRSPQPLPCRALQRRIGIICDWHNHKIDLRAYAPPRRKLPDPSGCSIPFSKLGLAALQCPPFPFREGSILKDSGGMGMEMTFIFHTLELAALLPAQHTVGVGTQSKPQNLQPLKPIRFTQQDEVRGIIDGLFSPADSNLLVFITADKETNHFVSKSKPRNQSHSLSNSCVVRGDRSRKDQSRNTLPRLK